MVVFEHFFISFIIAHLTKSLVNILNKKIFSYLIFVGFFPVSFESKYVSNKQKS